MSELKEMKGIINSYWHTGGYGAYQVARLEWDGMSIEFKKGYIPAYCGAMFFYDFEYNWELDRLYREYKKGGRTAGALRIREFYRRLRFFLGIQEVHGRYSDERLGMDIAFWEVEQRPMYGFGRSQRMSRVGPRVNPNSGNTAQFFAAPYDSHRGGRSEYALMLEKHGKEWVKVVSSSTEGIPRDDNDNINLNW